MGQHELSHGHKHHSELDAVLLYVADKNRDDSGGQPLLVGFFADHADHRWLHGRGGGGCRMDGLGLVMARRAGDRLFRADLSCRSYRNAVARGHGARGHPCLAGWWLENRPICALLSLLHANERVLDAIDDLGLSMRIRGSNLRPSGCLARNMGRRERSLFRTREAG